jgi:hypothetical protein
MRSERRFFTRLSGGIAVLAGALGLAAVLFLSARRGAFNSDSPPPVADGAHAIATAAEPRRPAASPPPRGALPESERPEIPKEILDAIQNGPQEPLTPPVIHVDAELAPGSVPTSEPLIPHVITIDTEPAQGGVPTSEPLVPPVIDDADHADHGG